jgi:putative ABC transport system permease protein
MLGLFRYNFKLAIKNIRRNPILSALMIAAIGIGIGASMSMITVNYRFSLNPIPHKSDVLHYVRLDSWSADFPFNEGRNPPNQVTYPDATALLAAQRAFRQVAMSRVSLAVEPPGRDERPFFVDVRATSRRTCAKFAASRASRPPCRSTRSRSVAVGSRPFRGRRSKTSPRPSILSTSKGSTRSASSS